MLILPGSAIGVALLGLFLAFSHRARMPRRMAGVLVILASLALGYYGGSQAMPSKSLTAPALAVVPELTRHAPAFVLGLVLLTWAVWILHRMRTTSLGVRR